MKGSFRPTTFIIFVVLIHYLACYVFPFSLYCLRISDEMFFFSFSYRSMFLTLVFLIQYIHQYILKRFTPSSFILVVLLPIYKNNNSNFSVFRTSEIKSFPYFGRLFLYILIVCRYLKTLILNISTFINWKKNLSFFIVVFFSLHSGSFTQQLSMTPHMYKLYLIYALLSDETATNF